MIQNKAMLVTLNISQWGNQKTDKRVAAEVDAAHQAKNAGKYKKNLVDPVYTKPISTLASEIREYHYRMTLPWGDNGQRLLPAKAYFDYTEAMRQYKQAFSNMVDDFTQNYQALVQAERQRLGTLYDPADYPASNEIKNYYGVNTHFQPVPDAKDFRVDIGKEEIAAIRKDITDNVAALQRDAIKDCWGRLQDVVEKIHDRLSNDNAIFRDSLIDNARLLCELLPKLNILEDPELEALRVDVQALLQPPQVLRDDKVLRAKTAQAAGDILNRMFPYAAAA